MAKVIVDVQLKNGIDQTTFLNDVTSNTAFEVVLDKGLAAAENVM